MQPYEQSELFKMNHGLDPVGLASYKKRHNIYTLRMHGRWTAFISTRPLEHHIGLSGELHVSGPAAVAATEIKALNRLARDSCIPTYDQWKFNECRRAANDH